MFGLAYGFYRWMFTKTTYNMIIVGLDGAGKTTLLEQSKTMFTDARGLPPDKIVPTVGLNIGRLVMGGVELLIWDLGGQATLRTIWPQYYSEAHAVIWVLDSTDAERFEDARAELEGVMGSELLVGKPLLLFVNKQDMPTARGPEELEQYFREAVERAGAGLVDAGETGAGAGGAGAREASDLEGGGEGSAAAAAGVGPQRQWRVQGMSALSGDGIGEGLGWLTDVLA
jgi:ADP-ribosylation factor related protein 1